MAEVSIAIKIDTSGLDGFVEFMAASAALRAIMSLPATQRAEQEGAARQRWVAAIDALHGDVLLCDGRRRVGAIRVQGGYSPGPVEPGPYQRPAGSGATPPARRRPR